MKILAFAALVLIFLAASISGQTAVQLKQKYGEPIQSYAVSDSIWMQPDFSADGRICRAQFYPKRVSDKTYYIIHALPRTELKELIERFAPPSIRGKIILGTTLNFGGGMVRQSIIYEKISFSFLSPFDPYFDILSENAKKELKKSKNPSTNLNKAAEEIEIPDDTEILTIVWNESGCAKF
jgi:hypothetical protein